MKSMRTTTLLSYWYYLADMRKYEETAVCSPGVCLWEVVGGPCTGAVGEGRPGSPSWGEGAARPPRAVQPASTVRPPSSPYQGSDATYGWTIKRVALKR
jgi:hypothetical protein